MNKIVKSGLCAVLMSVTSFVFAQVPAQQSGDTASNPCRDLVIDVHNATLQDNAILASGDEGASVVHGYIDKHGKQLLPAYMTTTWVMRQYPLSGPEGKITYTWHELSGQPHHCTIYYDQTYCGLTRAGYNLTHAEGHCRYFNEPGKPSLHWRLSGKTQVTLLPDKEAPTPTILTSKPTGSD